jgi:hypothetical protein
VPPLQPEFTVWMVNRFGDLIVVPEDGSVHYMDFSVNELRRITDSQDDFCTKIDQGDNADDWLLIPLVDACVAAGMRLLHNQCYSFKIPPVLSGKYEIENIAPLDIEVNYAFLADIHRQIKDLPDGTKINLVSFEDRALKSRS